MSLEVKKSTDEFTSDSFMPFVRPSLNQEAIDEVVSCLKSELQYTEISMKDLEKQFCLKSFHPIIKFPNLSFLIGLRTLVL